MKKHISKKLKLGKIIVSNLLETTPSQQGNVQQMATFNSCYKTCTTCGTWLC
ncbi:MAG TPA: hypothetical protein VM802_05250 [Chitinophaga sp.]|uniref:hypothetical protein n=1 Tax=Chitinophaga sp. TaxID=1869181 RepID=UPI002C18EB6C|nr:hypothetical protein [Chitinophaga sp.]HVI44249.1 hypothetical protein [Chitinophaga sp.]